MAKLQSSHMFAIKRFSLVLAVATSFLVVAASGAQASQDDDSVKKSGAVICPDGNPCPALPAGAIDCTPKNGVVPKQCSWQPGQGDPADELDNLDPDNLPDMSVVVGAARSATTFSFSAVINALGKYAALELFYFDYGDGTGFGSSASLRSLTSFPTTHIYVQAGTYKIVGYGKFEGKTECDNDDCCSTGVSTRSDARQGRQHRLESSENSSSERSDTSYINFVGFVWRFKHWYGRQNNF